MPIIASNYHENNACERGKKSTQNHSQTILLVRQTLLGVQKFCSKKPSKKGETKSVKKIVKVHKL